MFRIKRKGLQSILSNNSCSRRYHHVTHEVFNQGQPLINFDLFHSDPSLKSAIKSFETNEKGIKYLESYGKTYGNSSWIEIADTAEKNKPVLRQFDSYGRRIDIIDYHPTYHMLMKQGLQVGAASYGYNYNDHITRAALIYLQNQVEPGHCCPIVMTCAAIPVLRNHKIPQLDIWMNKVCTQDYDPSNAPISDKLAVTMGMSMTEKQGGSDVRANTTVATPIDSKKQNIGDEYYLHGHKWFTSAPMSDGFFTLAKLDMKQPPSLFLVPRWLPNGNRNTGFKIMRLKDKCADRANASSEIEYENAWAMLISEPGKGVKAIMDMVSSTRLDCCLGSAGTARRALQHVLAHTNTRQAFGSKLRNHPLMENLLVDLCIESEAHTLLAMRMASVYDKAEREHDRNHSSHHDEIEEAKELFRIGVSVSKYYITKRQPNFAYECMEIFGGNGFAEDFPMAKLFRHSPLNSIWEGSGNVIALDTLRGMKSVGYLISEIELAKSLDHSLDDYVMEVKKLVHEVSKDPMATHNQRRARLLADKLSVALEASLLLRYGNPIIAKGYIESRVMKSESNSYGYNYGSHVYSQEWSTDIIDRNLPVFL